MVAVAIRERDFEAAVHNSELVMRGCANGRSAERLERLIDETHRQLIAHGATTFVIDIRQVAQMSDICFNVLVDWIGRIQKLPTSSRYRLAFAIDPATTWQRRSVVTLASMAVDVVKLER
jgi:ABC-type transporter Mla MlaB component